MAEPVPRTRWIRRHSPLVRVTHWINVVCLTILVMSGLQIFNAHPALYWGQAADFDNPLLDMTAVQDEDGTWRGVTTILDHEFDTTGLFGLSNVGGVEVERGFPAWVTLPGRQWLAMGRRWHFFFAWLFVVNGLVYLTAGFLRGHFRRDLLPSGAELRHIPRTLMDHMRLRFPKGVEAERYNPIQKLAYLAVVFILLPLVALAGFTMSPRLDAAWPALLALFDGRQSARTIHFLVAATLVAFVVVHVAMVVLSGLWNNLRSMITGRYAIDEVDDAPDA